MEVAVANVDAVKFDIEVALEQQLGAQPLPFVGMDKSTSAVCEFFSDGQCNKGNLCPFRHVKGDRTVVCKHWLRGLCKKGDSCEFLHEYDLSRMPECYFFTRFNACHNKECPFLHIDADAKVKPCPWYDRGFCRHGPHCRHRHVRKVLCLNYLAGFCPDGPECKFVHVHFDLPQIDEAARNARKAGIICHICGEAGHKSYQCTKTVENSDAKSSDVAGTGMEVETNFPPNHQPPHNRPGHDLGPRKHDPRHNLNVDLKPHNPPTQQYQPYVFHPRPQFRPQRGDREDNQPRRALEDVVCYKMEIVACGFGIKSIIKAVCPCQALDVPCKFRI